jgi:hypothetical protein
MTLPYRAPSDEPRSALRSRLAPSPATAATATTLTIQYNTDDTRPTKGRAPKSVSIRCENREIRRWLHFDCCKPSTVPEKLAAGGTTTCSCC